MQGPGCQQGLQSSSCRCCATYIPHQLGKPPSLCWPRFNRRLHVHRARQYCCAAPVQALDAAVRSFEPHLETLASALLRQLLTPGQTFPDLAQPLAELEQATDWEEAASTGRVVPAEVGSGKGNGWACRVMGTCMVFPCREGRGLPAVAPACCSATAALHPLLSCELGSGRTWAGSVQQSHANAE